MKSAKCFWKASAPAMLMPEALKLPAILLFLLFGAPGYSSIPVLNSKPVLPPVALCKNITLVIGTGGTVSISPADINAGSYDPDGTITSMSVTPNLFSCSQKGVNSVILTVTDNEGLSASCTAQVSVEDKMVPAVVCRDYTLYLNAAGKGSLVPSDIDNGSSDNCASGLFFYLSKTDFTCTDTGSPVTVTLIGTDGSGNSSSCTSQITVLDTISPVINYKPFELVLGSSGSATLSASDIDNGTFDNCGNVTLSVNPSVFTCSNLGQNIVVLTATDSHGNSSHREVPISVSSTLKISGMSLSSCDMAPALALYAADKEGGDGNYSSLWKGLTPSSLPFMVIIPFPPSLQFSATSTLEKPFFNNTMPDGYYDIRLVVTDGNGCKDSSDIRINKTGAIFNNQTMRYTEACEGEVKSYSVIYKPDASYSWSVTNGTILDSNTDTSRINVLWNTGVLDGRVVTTLTEPNSLFAGSECGSTVIDTVTITPLPNPSFINPATNVCHSTPATYTLTTTYAYQHWTVVGGVIVSGGNVTDNYVTINWNDGPSGIVSVSAGNNAFCTSTLALTVTVFNLQGSVTSLSDITCNGGSDGSVTVAAGPGTGMAPYQYSLDGGGFVSGSTFTGLSLGNHTVRIRDALMCTFDVPFVIDQPTPVTATVSSLKNVSCFGGSDGSVTITASGGTPPYQYRLNGGPLQGSNVFNGLAAGPYTITITDSHGCSGIVMFSVIQPAQPLNGSASVTNVACFGETTGRVVLTVTGGTGPYSYLWSNGTTLKDLENVPAGNYNVIITDTNGCTFIVNASVAQPSAALAGSSSVTNVLCFGASTGGISLTITGGTTPYSFLWNTGAVTKDLTNVPSGNYSVTITDANGCTLDLDASVAQPPSALNGSVSVQKNVSCFSGNDGSVTIAGSGGTGPYMYRLGAGTFQASGTFSALAAGNYTITIRDANLCTYNLPVTITQPVSPLGGTVVSLTNARCFGEATGSVTVSGSGGTTPYEYSIDAGPWQPSGSFTGLAAGSYNVTIRDINQCTIAGPVNISQPSQALSVSATYTDVLCVGASTGTATAVAAGGTAPYTYSWNSVPSQTTPVASNLPAGNYIVTITDNNDCISTATVTINQPAAALAAAVSVIDATCHGGSDGSINLTVSNGTAPFTFTWSNGAVTEDLSNISAGSYNVTVNDANGCSAVASASVGQPSQLTGSITATGPGCFGESTGSCNLTVTGGTPPYSFIWNTGATTEDLTDIPSGNYSVTVTDFNGCPLILNTTVSQPASPLNGSLVSVSDVTVYGGNDGSITVQGSGGTSPYQYAIDSGAFQSTGTFGSLMAGTYTITVRDSKLCTFDLTATINQPWIPLTANIVSQTNVPCSGGSQGSVTAAGWGGTSPYMYSLNGAPYQASGTFSSLSAGSYTIFVRDGVSDIFNLTVEITQSESLGLIVTPEDPHCLGGNDGSAVAVPSGGTAPYSYIWSTDPAQNTQTATNLSAGTYSVTVTDANGCTATGSVLLTQPSSELTVGLAKTDVLCEGSSTGTASVSASGGLPPYNYSWNTTPVQTTQTASNLPAGTYAVSVTDFNGCTKTGTVTIAELQSLTVTTSVGEASCPDSNDGTVTLAISGGTAPYNIFWSDGAATLTRTGLYTGRYGVIVTDHNGCAQSLFIDVGFDFSFNCLVIPQVITPNGDGFNDEWIIRNIGYYPNAEVHIFNRWGQEVFSTKNLADNPWDGRYKGKLVPTDSYHFILYLNDGSGPRTGVISVIR